MAREKVERPARSRLREDGTPLSFRWEEPKSPEDMEIDAIWAALAAERGRWARVKRFRTAAAAEGFAERLGLFNPQSMTVEVHGSRVYAKAHPLPADERPTE